MSIIQSLKKSPLFHNLSESIIQEIENKGQIKQFQKEQTLFNQGDPGQNIFMLIEGAIKLFRLSKDGKEVIIKLVRPGEIFAEVILYEDPHYPVNAQSVIQSSVFSIPKDAILELLAHGEFRDHFIGSIMKRLRYLTNRLYYLSAYDVEERFFQLLRQRYGMEEKYFINISKKEFASAMGATPETLSRLLLRLAQRKIVQWRDDTITILDPTIWDSYPLDD